MQSTKAIDGIEIAGAPPERSVSVGTTRHLARPKVGKLWRRSLFQKIVIANTALICAGTIMGLYLERWFLPRGEVNLLLPLVSGAVLMVLINYVLVKVALDPVADVSEIVKAVRAGHRGVRAPEKGKTELTGQLCENINAIIDAMERCHTREAAAVIRAQEQERNRIARELHDETSQSLSGLLLAVGAVEECISVGSPQARERLDNIRKMATATMEDVHDLAFRLRPSALDDLGLACALRSYVNDFSKNTGIGVDLHMERMEGRLPSEHETVLFRVVQEALTNVARHADADSCQISLERRDTQIHGLVTDNGRGFDADSVARHKNRGLGLRGMRERVELVGGFLKFYSRPDEGTTVYLNVPIETGEGAS
jgi:two-component system sensor histidine kinase UhpB